MIRLLLADDHAILRGGLKQLLSLATDIVIAGEAENGRQVLDALRSGDIDLLMLDMSMPGISGTDLIARVHAQQPELPILILSMHNESQFVRRALRAGASGYITKDSNPEALLTAIRKVAGGGRFIDSRLAEDMAFEASAEGKPHTRLSNREFEVLRLIARGMGINDIAAELSISNKTVSTHKARLMEKMGLGSNADLLRYAVVHGLAD